jgi:hypothetical protein
VPQTHPRRRKPRRQSYKAFEAAITAWPTPIGPLKLDPTVAADADGPRAQSLPRLLAIDLSIARLTLSVFIVARRSWLPLPKAADPFSRFAALNRAKRCCGNDGGDAWRLLSVWN